MEYRLREDHAVIRKAFTDRFVMSYSDFCRSRKESAACMGRCFDEKYFERMLFWEKLSIASSVLPFRDALEYLKNTQGNVLFLTEPSESDIRQFCQLNNRREYVAEAAASALAECAAYEWFTDYELADQGCYLADPLLPAELYIFDEGLSWCLIFTHETDETESAESRVCFLIDMNREASTPA